MAVKERPRCPICNKPVDDQTALMKHINNAKRRKPEGRHASNLATGRKLTNLHRRLPSGG